MGPRDDHERDEPGQHTAARDALEAGTDLNGHETDLGGCEHGASWHEAMSEV